MLRRGPGLSTAAAAGSGAGRALCRPGGAWGARSACARRRNHGPRPRPWLLLRHACSTLQEKTAEPWILAGDLGDLTGRQLRLVVCAYIRPEVGGLWAAALGRPAWLPRWAGFCLCRAGPACVAWALLGAIGPPCQLDARRERKARSPAPTTPPLRRFCTAAPLTRPQANFSSLQALIDRIQRDGQVAKEALARPEYQRYRQDPWLLPAGAGAGEAAAAGGTADS